MSKENSEIKLINSNEDEKFYSKYKPWRYPDSTTDTQCNQNRNCCSPADEINELAKDVENLNTTHTVEVKTDKPALYLLKQDTTIDCNGKRNSNQVINNKKLQSDKKMQFFNKSNLKYYQTNELENAKEAEKFAEEKISEKLPANNNSDVYNEYIETDLDQPMDYTLCYDEANLEEKKGNPPFFPKNDFLCIEETIEGDKVPTVKQKGGSNKESTRNKKEMFSNTSRSFKEIFNFFKDRDKKRAAIENTKISSFEGSKLIKNTEIFQQKIDKTPQQQIEQCEKESKLRSDVQCSQQTPLMLSRYSSLESLNGFEQNSINDDPSSVISDASQKTSDVASPSDLPDSPAQSITSGTKLQQKSQINCFVKKKIQTQYDKLKISQHSLVLNENSFLQQENNNKKPLLIKTSVFEDNITSFKDESTPTKLHSVAASSLSSLTIDDDDEYEVINKLMFSKEKQIITEEVESENIRKESIEKSNLLVNSAIKSDKIESISNDIDEDINGEQDDELTDLTSHEEQLLDQCIRTGIAKWTKQNPDDIKPFSWDMSLTCRATRAMLISRIRINSDIDIHNHVVEKTETLEKDDIIKNNNSDLKEKIEDESLESESCNEKHSDKETDSIESLSNLKENIDQFDKNSYYITYEEHLLDQCIRRGMAKITKKNVNDIKPFSWDANQICLTTRAMMLRNRDGNFHLSH